MTMILIKKLEMAHLYINDRYIGAVGDTKEDVTIKVLDVFSNDFRIEVNGVCLFINRIIIKEIAGDIISSYICKDNQLIEKVRVD